MKTERMPLDLELRCVIIIKLIFPPKNDRKKEFHSEKEPKE